MDAILLDLVKRSQRGDREAFAGVVRGCARLVFARILVERGSRDGVEDLVQETFITAWKRLGELREPEAFLGWIGMIASRTVVDAQRRAGRKKRMRVEEAERREEAGLSAAEEAGDGEEQARLLACLRELPEAYRMPLMLRFLDGAEPAEIAKKLGLTSGSLRGYLHRGLALLREKYLGRAIALENPQRDSLDENGGQNE